MKIMFVSQRFGRALPGSVLKDPRCKLMILHLYAQAFTLGFASSDGHAGLKGQHIRMNLKFEV